MTSALHRLEEGQNLTVRGPYGNSFPVEDWKGKNILTIGGGIGQAPLRSIIQYVLDNRSDYGTLDLVCANLSHPRFLAMNPPFIMDLSRVYLNTGHDFQDHTVHAGLKFRETTTDPLLADFNNDGHLDLSMTNCYRVWVNQLYEGVGDGSFREVTFRTGAFASDACGQAAADFDNDGDLDWFVIDGNKGLLLYENKLIDGGRIPDSANWIELKLHGGNHVNSMAYGARVKVKANGRVYVREVAGMRGYSSCDDQVVHIGLGAYAGKVSAEVRWIGDKIQELSELDVNKRHEISIKFDTPSFP